MKRKIFIIIGLVFIMLFFILIKNSKAAQIIEDGIYVIKSGADSKYVLDVSGVSMENGGNIQLWENADVDQQRFKVKYVDNGYYILTAMHSKKAMSVSENKNVEQYEYNNSDNQKWKIIDNGDGFYSFISKKDELYLETTEGQIKNKINIQVGNKNNSNEQKFKLENTKCSIEDGIYVIQTSLNLDYVLDVSGISMFNGGNIQLWENSNVNQQKFNIKYNQDGYYTLAAVHSGKGLNVEKNNNVSQYELCNLDTQKWIIKEDENGFFELISKGGVKYLTSSSNNIVNQTNIIVSNKRSNNSQKFKIISINEEQNKITGAQTINDGVYKIKTSINSNYVLDVAGISIENGANIQLWQDSDVDQQRFSVKYQGNGYYTLEALHSKKVISTLNSNKTQGLNVCQQEYTNKSNQRWIIKECGDGFYYIISGGNGLYLETSNNSIINSTNIEVGVSTGKDNQKFKFEKIEATILQGTQSIEDGIYEIRTKLNNNYILDVAEISLENGGNIQLWEDSNVEQQRFEVKYQGNGNYALTALHSGKALSVDKSGNVVQYDYQEYENQKWIIKDCGSGYYNLISAENGLYLETEQNNITNKVNIKTGRINGKDNQKFKFEEILEQRKQTIEDGIYEIGTKLNNNYILDVAGISLENNGNVQLWEEANVNQQKFKFIYQEDGYYTIIAMHSLKALTVGEESNVFQYDFINEISQKWIIKDYGSGEYSIISALDESYLEVDGTNIECSVNIKTGIKDSSNGQIFFLKRIDDFKEIGSQTLKDGIYEIKTKIDEKYVLDVAGASLQNNANIQLWEDSDVNQQRFEIKYNGDGYYILKVKHSKKVITAEIDRNVNQYDNCNVDTQKWIIKDLGNEYYAVISKYDDLYLETCNNNVKEKTNIQVGELNGKCTQKFKFEKVEDSIFIDSTKYPGYKEKIEELMEQHPNWNFELLYTGLKFSDVIAGETAVHSRNLVPTTYAGEWICASCGTRLYDSGWYCASAKAVAYYMDPRNFLDETNVFQFVDVNQYTSDFTNEAIQIQVNGTYLQNYANDVNVACRNQGVNPFYIISRLIQEQGRYGTTIGTGMDGGDGKTYYNPFDIGASGNGYSEIYANALARAKSEGWDTMEKAIEGGITFCKKNWLDNYQNTLYQNKFDIDTRNGSALYNHQYMQNLMGAYSEAILFKGMYDESGLTNSNITFIIPIYENMEENYSIPVNNTETYPMDVQTTGTYVRIREEANTSSNVLRTIEYKGTKLLSIQRGINSNWQKVMTSDGLIGYISGDFVEQIDDISTCNYNAIVKTNDGYGCNVRVGPSTKVEKITGLADNTAVTVIDDSTYRGIDGYDWCRIIMAGGTQAFIPSKYLSRK